MSDSTLKRVCKGAICGSTIALFFIGVGLVCWTIAFLIGLEEGLLDEGESPASSLIGLGLFIIGFAVSGAVVGLLWPMSVKRSGSYLLGIIGAVIAQVFILATVAVVSHARMEVKGFAITMIVISTLAYGLILGQGIRKHREATDRQVE